jgi:2'-5' RNA ligase
MAKARRSGCVYNHALTMVSQQRYALVAYVKNQVGEFVERLRKELHPELPHLAAHVTLLPPRLVHGPESAALQTLEQYCKKAEPFEVSLGEVETFIPVTPTVFIRVAHAAYRMREVHDLLNVEGLQCKEELPYMPHLTIVKMGAEDEAQYAYRVARTRWAEFEGSRCIEVRDVTFVREEAPYHWVDLATVPLGEHRTIATGNQRR